MASHDQSRATHRGVHTHGPSSADQGLVTAADGHGSLASTGRQVDYTGDAVSTADGSIGRPGPGDGQMASHGVDKTSAPQGTSASGKPIRRRMRMITSCLECRRRKLKCNKSQTCTNCVRFNRECRYLGPKLDEASQLRLTEIKEKVGSLERQLERDVAKSTTSPGASRSKQQHIVADDFEDQFDEEQDLEITPFVALDLTYEDDADGTDDIIDLGIQVGKMRITERIGGLNRPRISEEIEAGLSGAPRPPGHGQGPPGYRPSSGASPQGPYSDTSHGSPEITIPDFLRPTASYIPPTSGFFFGQVVQSPSLLSFLPTYDMGNRMKQRYHVAVHPIARCVHWPSFEVQYATFWDDVRQGYEPRPSIQAVVFAAWLSAIVSMDEGAVQREYNFTKTVLMENMKIGTEAALSKANFLRTTKVETLQAFVMYMIPICRDEVSRAHSVLVGAAVRMAECMGLHRDGDAYGLTPLETHVRRLIWHQLCFLDIRTCEAQGPKPAIRREDYDTKLPLNCEEDELTHATTAPEPAEHWTSSLLPLVRFEINEMMRVIWMDRRKLETRKMTLPAVLSKIENFRKRMIEKYEGLLDDHVPIQRYTKLVMGLLMWRLHSMVLHPYYANASNPLPPRLNAVLIMSGIMVIEVCIQLETNALFADWAWYAGAYQQYQIALLLATEMFYRPTNKEADRIWTCLDYAFNMDRNMPREEKGVRILQEIVGKTSVYMGMRKMRAPTGISRAVPDQQAVRTAAPSPAASAASASPRSDSSRHGAGPQAGAPQRPSASGPPAPMPAYAQALSQQQTVPGVKVEGGIRPPMGMPPAPPYAHGHGPPQRQGAMQSMPPNAGPGMPMPMPMPQVVFAGVSNGEALWSLPPNMDNHEGGGKDGMVSGGSSTGSPGNILDMDWAALEEIFPQDPQTGELTMTGYVNPSMGMKWQ